MTNAKYFLGCSIKYFLSETIFCVQIVVLDQGQVVEVGTHTQLLERGGKYANLWRHQQQEQEKQENQGEEKKTGEDEEE